MLDSICVHFSSIVHLLSFNWFVKGVEATLFATLMSILNFGGFAGTFIGGIFTTWFGVTSDNFDNLAALVTLATFSSLLPLPLLRLVPDTSSSEQQKGT